jgi:outer membrane protein assembly factor BamB
MTRSRSLSTCSSLPSPTSSKVLIATTGPQALTSTGSQALPGNPMHRRLCLPCTATRLVTDLSNGRRSLRSSAFPGRAWEREVSIKRSLFPAMVSKLTVCLVSVGIALSTSHFGFADWSGLLGSNRDGHASVGSQIPDSISGSLQVRWEFKAGQGYAGASISNNQVCLFDREGKENKVRLVDLSNGKLIWQQSLATSFYGGMDADKGPRSVPTITDDTIVLLDAGGEAYGLDRKSGSMRWKRSLLKDFQAEEGFFGVGSTPLVVGDRIVVCVGGKKGGIACLSLKDGKTIWQSTKDEASYSSPISLAPADTNTVVVTTRTSIYGIDVASGQERWKVPFGKKSQSVVAATPILLSDGNIFVTAAYEVGHAVLQCSGEKATVKLRGNVLESQYATPVRIGSYLYASDGREDFSNGRYKCLSEADMSVKWEKESMPICHSVAVGDKLLLSGVDGSLRAIRADPASYVELWKTQLAAGLYRALPAIEGNTLIVRSESKWLALSLSPADKSGN